MSKKRATIHALAPPVYLFKDRLLFTMPDRHISVEDKETHTKDALHTA